MSDHNGVTACEERPVAEPLAALAGVSETALLAITERMNAAFAETQRRDDNAVAHARTMTTTVWLLLGVWVATVAVGLWFFTHTRDVEVVVHTVVYDKEGQFVSLGVPQHLLDFVPKDGEWLTMLRRWVQSYRWRTDEHERLLTQEAWKWLYAHTCGGAAEKLAAYEKAENPLVRTDVVRSVKLQPISKTPTTFVAVWEETTINKSTNLKTTAWQVGTFTVGRTLPTTRAEADLNTLGLCVTSYDIKDGTAIN